ncbi:CASP-like protein 1D1 [Momordica charantia]|uniref:CASP-like protein n=1 Tax=Momordica charantia TaxID=3673 RepID=A0A6J1C942_MOMCH|nr:CASP-like protein 1D1 [Momordica charantia]
MASPVEKPLPESAAAAAARRPRVNLFAIDAGLRMVLFAAAVATVVVTVTSKQTVVNKLRGVPPGFPVQAKFDDSPAFIYFVTALSVTALYSLITALASVSVISNPNLSAKFLLHFAFLDALILGVVASATGTAGGVAYIGLKGNSHVQWNKVCYAFDKFCRHIGGALAASLFASVVLALLIWLSVFSLHARIRK